MISKNNQRTINAWAMYDWANSVYSLVITTAIFPGYFYGVTGGKDAVVNVLGFSFLNTSLYTYSLAFAFLLVAVINPVLSALADISGHKKRFMQFFCFMGAAACAALFFFTESNLLFGVSMFMLAGVGYAGSLVFYNSFLPEIATEDRFDQVSAKGFALGYVGSVILLALNLWMVQGWDTAFGDFFVSKGQAVRYSFLSVGVWWFGFSLITFARLPTRASAKISKGLGVIAHAKNEFLGVWSEVQQLPLLRRFLFSFLFYSMGVQTVMYVATLFGEDVVGMKTEQLIVLVLLLQIVAIGGAYVFSKISMKKGNIFAIKLSILVWTLICVVAFFMSLGMVTEFYVLGVFVGLMMGAIQSMSRSTYAKFIPKETTDHASYFSFFETVEKFSIAIGSMTYGLINQLTGSMHYSALAMSLFFVIGFLIIRKIPSKQIYNTTLISPK